MGRKPRVDRSPEEKWQIVQEGIKSGNVSETCRRHGIAPNLFYRWKDEAEQGAKAALGGVSCGEVHSQAREMVTQGHTPTRVAATLAISRSSLYYRKKPRGSRADRRYDEQIVVACGEKLAYGYRRVGGWLSFCG